MSDISQCTQSGCKKRKHCLRYLAVPEEQPRKQAYADFTLCADDHEDYWPIQNMASPTIRAWRDVDKQILTGEQA